LRLRESRERSNLPLEIDVIPFHPRLIDQLDRSRRKRARSLDFLFQPDLAKAADAELLYPIPSRFHFLSEYTSFWIFPIEEIDGTVGQDLGFNLAGF
jgi:hypothetical protein